MTDTWVSYGGRSPGSKARRFMLVRNVDSSGVSGTGIVAHGVQFWDGVCVIRWDTHTSSTAIYDSIEDLERIHGHGGFTVIEWVD